MGLAAQMGCQSRAEKFYNLAQEKIHQRQYLDAVNLLENSAELEKNNRIWSKTNFEMATLLRLDIHDYSKAIHVYRQIILKSEDANLRIQSQQALADIYFENIQDYLLAIKELLLLESLETDAKNLEKIRLKLAQAYKYTGQFKTALEVVDLASKNAQEQKLNFLKLKYQIFNSLDQPDKALTSINLIELIDKEFFISENLFLDKAMIFEQKQDYKSSLETIKQYAQFVKDKNYLDLRLKRLQNKLTNKPFARGIRK